MHSLSVIFLSIGLALLAQSGSAVDRGPTKSEADLHPAEEQVEASTSDSVIIEQLLMLANDPNPYARVEAIERLYFWRQEPKVAAALRAAVHDDVWLVRRAAGIYGTREDIYTQLEDEDPKIRYSAVYRVIQLGDPRLVDLLIDRLYDPSPMVVFDSLFALHQINDKRAIKPLLEFMLSHKESESTVRPLVEELASEPFERVFEKYKADLKPAPKEKITFKQIDAASQFKMLEHGDLPQRVSAALRLAWANKPEAIDALIRALQDKESAIRAAAAEALGADPLLSPRATERVLSSLKEGITDSDPLVRGKSMSGVGRFLFGEYKAQTIEFLGKAAEDEKDRSVRVAAIRALETAHTTRSSEILIDFLNDSSPEIRAYAVGGVDLECLPKGTEEVMKALYDPDPSVRREAAFSLGQARDQMALQPLLDALIDSDESVRLAAAQSLGTLKDPEAIPQMKEVTENDPSEEVRRVTKQSIRLIKNHAAGNPLVNRLFKLISKWMPLPEHCKG